MAKQLTFGVSFAGAPDAAAWRSKARWAEEAGYSHLFVPDHLGPGMLAPLPALAIAAEATSRLRVGSLVVNNDFRHPAVLAQEVATLDLLTDGRFELGIGTGNRPHEYQQAGMLRESGRVRLERLAECLVVLRALLLGDPVSYRGVYYDIDGLVCRRRPGVRITVGGTGNGILGLGAELADGVNFVGIGADSAGKLIKSQFGLDAMRAQVEFVRQRAASRFDQVELSLLVHHVEVTRRARHAAALVGEWLPGTTTDEVLGSPYVLIGSLQELRDRLSLLRDVGICRVVVFGDSANAMAQVMATM